MKLDISEKAKNVLLEKAEQQNHFSVRVVFQGYG